MRLSHQTMLVVSLAVLVTGCGGGGNENPATRAQPSPNVTTFEPGVFDEIPRHPRSEPVGERSDENGVITRSFAVRDAEPTTVLQFFEDRLSADWELVSQPQEIGVDTYRGTWARDNWILTISATRAETVDADSDAAQGTYFSQYSLNLSPRSTG